MARIKRIPRQSWFWPNGVLRFKSPLRWQSRRDLREQELQVIQLLRELLAHKEVSAVAVSAVADTREHDPLIGRAMRKRFRDGILYRGLVTGERTLDKGVRVYKISYDDGDSEELEQYELTPLLYKRARRRTQ